MKFHFGKERVFILSEAERAKLMSKVKVRRFPPGSSDSMIQEAIDALGYKLAPNHGKRNQPWRLWKDGAKKPRNLTSDELMEIVDGWRKRRGKPPLLVKK